MPYVGWPDTTSARSAAASGKPGWCFSRLGCTCAYASITELMTSGRSRFRSLVEVGATRPSTSNLFEYTRNLTIDIWSSGSLAMSVRTTMRGLDEYGSMRAATGSTAGGACAKRVADAASVIDRVRCRDHIRPTSYCAIGNRQSSIVNRLAAFLGRSDFAERKVTDY